MVSSRMSSQNVVSDRETHAHRGIFDKGSASMNLFMESPMSKHGYFRHLLPKMQLSTIAVITMILFSSSVNAARDLERLKCYFFQDGELRDPRSRAHRETLEPAIRAHENDTDWPAAFLTIPPPAIEDIVQDLQRHLNGHYKAYIPSRFNAKPKAHALIKNGFLNYRVHNTIRLEAQRYKIKVWRPKRGCFRFVLCASDWLIVPCLSRTSQQDMHLKFYNKHFHNWAGNPRARSGKRPFTYERCDKDDKILETNMAKCITKHQPPVASDSASEESVSQQSQKRSSSENGNQQRLSGSGKSSNASASSRAPDGDNGGCDEKRPEKITGDGCDEKQLEPDIAEFQKRLQRSERNWYCKNVGTTNDLYDKQQLSDAKRMYVKTNCYTGNPKDAIFCFHCGDKRPQRYKDYAYKCETNSVTYSSRPVTPQSKPSEEFLNNATIWKQVFVKVGKSETFHKWFVATMADENGFWWCRSAVYISGGDIHRGAALLLDDKKRIVYSWKQKVNDQILNAGAFLDDKALSRENPFCNSDGKVVFDYDYNTELSKMKMF